MKKHAYRIKEFCQCYAISRASLYREVAAGRLKVFKRGRSTLISHAAAQRWLKKLSLNQNLTEKPCCRSSVRFSSRRKKNCLFGACVKFFIRKWK